MGGFFGCSTSSSTSGGGGIGNALTFNSPSGTIDPNLVGFVAGVGTSGTGRLKVTLSGNTAWKGLPAGLDRQQLFVEIVSGNFILTLLGLNGATALKKISASGDFNYGLLDTAQLYYDSGLAQWVLVA